MPPLHRFALLVLLVAGLAYELPAQDAACLERTLPVTVRDKQGNPVEGLTTKDFRGEFRGQPVEMLAVEWDTGPRRIVLALDHSESMTVAMRVVRGVAVQMIQQVPPDVSLALRVFGKGFEASLDFSHDRTSLLAEVGGLSDEAQGLTPLFASLKAATELFEPPQRGDVVYAITDGIDTASQKDWREVERILVRNEIRLFVFRPRTDPYDVRMDADKLRRLSRVVTSSGGNMLVYSPSRITDIHRDSTVYQLTPEQEARLAAALALLYQEIDRFYRVEARLPRVVEKDRTWKLEVVGPEGKKRKDLTVIYPQRLFPCEEKAAAAAP